MENKAYKVLFELYHAFVFERYIFQEGSEHVSP